jgi:ubiquinone/menaquinone biosynthesis C-methylase UbiE
VPVIDDAVAFLGHQAHVMRRREVGTLLGWAGDLSGRRLLDVAGGDGYWAGQAMRQGARAICLDIARPKLEFGRRLRNRPALVEGDALALPFAAESFDVLLSVCAIEHFNNGPAALDEMVRVLRPSGDLVISADAMTQAERWPKLTARHCERYHVKSTYSARDLRRLLMDRGLRVMRQTYMFRAPSAERLYLGLSARGGRFGWNAAALLSPLIAAWDRRTPDETGSVVLTHARKPPK